MHVPQPHPDRLTEIAGHPVVVGVVPSQDALVALTAASLARAAAASVHFAFVDTSRYVEREFADGDVDHRPISPDASGDEWRTTDSRLRSEIAAAMADTGVEWRFHYLAGRIDRALTHLARAVDAGVIVLGAQHAGMGTRMHEFFEGSVALRLTHHQHRPVLVVPLRVTDWKDEPAWR